MVSRAGAGLIGSLGAYRFVNLAPPPEPPHDAFRVGSVRELSPDAYTVGMWATLLRDEDSRS